MKSQSLGPALHRAIADACRNAGFEPEAGTGGTAAGDGDQSRGRRTRGFVRAALDAADPGRRGGLPADRGRADPRVPAARMPQPRAVERGEELRGPRSRGRRARPAGRGAGGRIHPSNTRSAIIVAAGAGVGLRPESARCGPPDPDQRVGTPVQAHPYPARPGACHADHPDRLRPRLPRHVLAARACRGRPGACAWRAIPTSRSPPASPARKVNRDAELVHSPAPPGHPAAPHRAEGRGPVRADHLGRRRSTRSPRAGRRSSPSPARSALLGYAYSAHQGQMNRGLLNGLFHALGAAGYAPERSATPAARPRGTRRSGRSAAPIPRRSADSDLVIAWGADLIATNVHFWAKIEQRRKRACKLVVIDPRRSRTAARSPTGTCRSASAPMPRWRSA